MNINDASYKKTTAFALFAVIALATIVHIAASFINQPFQTDISCFKLWSDMLFENGLSSFYSLDAFTDYPPGYMYVLYLIGFIKNTFALSSDNIVYEFIIKLPAMLCDIGITAFLFVIANKKAGLKAAFLISLCYGVNPAVIINSAIWGQVDAIYTFILIISLYYLSKKNYYISFSAFALAVLIKPQSIIFTPVFLLAIYNIYKEHNSVKSTLRDVCKYVGCALALFLFLTLPFTQNFNFLPIIEQYLATLGSYSYASVNAYNAYTLIGANWKPLSDTFFAIPFSVWGSTAIVAITVLIFYLYNKNKCNCFYLLCAALSVLTFMFSVKMHERYIYPALAFLLLAYIETKDKKIGALFVGFSVTLFINCVDILRVYSSNQDFSIIATSSIVVSLANVALTVLLIYIICPVSKLKGHPKSTLHSTKSIGINRELAILALITVVYSGFAFVGLGDTKSAQSALTAEKGEQITIDFGKEVSVDKIMIMNGAINNIELELLSSYDGVNFSTAETILISSVFYWHDISLSSEINTQYLAINTISNNSTINELAFYSAKELIIPLSYSNNGKMLFDEQELVPKSQSYKNSTYFDEIYHARTAYEILHKNTTYENTHPPLGKTIIGMGISMFGMTPFGWRFMGALCGVLMLPLIYLFAKKLTGSSFFSLSAAALLSFDFMHFSQTRIATIDSYTTLFILGAYYCMYVFFNMSKDASYKKMLLALFASGVFMGLSIAVKWQGAYTVVGLAILFFVGAVLKFKDNIKLLVITCIWCVLFFVVIPTTLYALSYIPYFSANNIKGLTACVTALIENQKDMFVYHSSLTDTHPYQSAFWQWPLNIRPIFMYAKSISATSASGISSFGNPAVWLAGLIAIIVGACSLFKKVDKNILFLIIAIASQYLPWALVSRCMFIYHFFPSVPFMILLTVYLIKRAKVNSKTKAIVLISVSAILFLMFYPVLSGVEVSRYYVDTFLRWLPTWPLII